ncbi:tyrosine-type recombinase/integrase [Corynebacterium striatum]
MLNLTAWRGAMIARNFTVETIKTRLYHVSAAADFLGGEPSAWTRAAVEDYLAAGDWAPATRRSIHASLKAYCRWCPDIDGAGPLAEIPAPRVPRSLPRPASEDAVMAALRAAGPREQLMIELMAYGGLRRGEVARVKGSDVQGQWLRVEGKGGHVRLVPLPPHLARRIAAHGTGWLFPGQINGHLSPRRVTELVGEVLPAGVTPHALRHRFATRVYAQSGDIVALSMLLGHAKLDTTMVYTQVDSVVQAQAAAGAWTLAAS